jgi:mxaA protein
MTSRATSSRSASAHAAIAALGALAALATSAAHAQAVQTQEPRAYGYVVGDLVERRAEITLPAGARIAEASLPRRGRIDTWLELRDVVLRPHRGGAELHLVYQVVNAPRQVATVELPALTLALEGTAQRAIDVEAWPITVSAMTPNYVLARAGLDELQPDIAPQREPLVPRLLRLGLWTTLCAAALYLLALRRFPQLAWWRRRAPFRSALLDLRRLARQRDRDAAYPAALQRLHTAFDTAAGQALFAERLEPLFEAQPPLRALADEVHAFYAQSRRTFFAAAAPAQADGEAMTALLALARRLAQHERAS